MTRPGALPRYLQIAEALTRDIAAGRLVDGERLPPERRMAEGLGVSVATLRQALAQLTDRGLLVRRQGSGNTVRAAADPTSVYAMLRLELVSGGGLPTAEVLQVDRLAKDPRLPAFGASPEGHRIRRLRRLAGQIAAVEEIWLDGACADRLDAAELSDSLYLHYRARLGLWIARAEDRVGQGALPDWSPAAFPHAPGTLLPRITRVAWDRDGGAVEASWTWYDPDIAAYTVRLT